MKLKSGALMRINILNAKTDYLTGHNTICIDCGDSFNAPDSRYVRCDHCEETVAANTPQSARNLASIRGAQDRETFETYYE